MIDNLNRNKQKKILIRVGSELMALRGLAVVLHYIFFYTESHTYYIIIIIYYTIHTPARKKIAYNELLKRQSVYRIPLKPSRQLSSCIL